MEILIGILIPFIGTTAGAACVYFMKNKLNLLVQKILLGFASGVMVAASVWSLLIPAMICQRTWENWLLFLRQLVFYWE